MKKACNGNLNLYQVMNCSEKDIIKKDIYEFTKIAYIMNHLKPILINKEYYYYKLYETNNLKAFILFIAKECYEQSELNLNSNSSSSLIDFVIRFYDIFQPIEFDYNNFKIYPKLSIKKFIANCIKEKKYDNYYISEGTLKKLIMMISIFSKYELQNIDSKDFGYINYPTLILANLKLYQKGILTIEMNDHQKVVFYLKSMNKKSKEIRIFDEQTLKNKIIQTLNTNGKLKYILEDFQK